MMVSVVDQQSNGYKHFCKICNKGFMCGRALGGHLHTHGIGDHSFHLKDDEDPVSADWDGPKVTHSSTGTNNNIDAGGNSRQMYALRTNPNRMKSCRTCDNCAKEFSSWKSFLEHDKCGASDDLDESLASSLGGSEKDEYYDDEDDGDDGWRGCRWSKRKRSMRVKVDNFGSICPSSEEEDLANCLMMLSSGMVDNPTMAEPEESCASASMDEDRRRPPPISFNPRLTYRSTTTMDNAKGIGNNNNKGVFECKACKKLFNSHQALGGHRASHKKVKGCFAARIDREYDYVPDDDALSSGEFFLTKSTSILPFNHGPFQSSSKKKSKVHECSICHRVFSSGQALGGHKRCHRITSNGAAIDVPSLAKLASLQVHLERIQQQRPSSFINVDHEYSLDLNLPASLMTDARNFDKVVSTEMYLWLWLGFDAKEILECNNRSAGNHCDIGVKKTNENNVINDCGPLADNNHNNDGSRNNLVNVADEETDSKVKLANLSKLNDTKIDGSSSSWLQVRIGLTAAEDEAATLVD